MDRWVVNTNLKCYAPLIKKIMKCCFLIFMILASSWWVTSFVAVWTPIFVSEHLTDEHRVVVVLNDWRMDKEIKHRTEIRVPSGSKQKAYWHLHITERARGVFLVLSDRCRPTVLVSKVSPSTIYTVPFL